MAIQTFHIGITLERVLMQTFGRSKDLGFYVFRTLICIVGKP